MENNDVTVISGVVLDETSTVSMAELCRCARLSADALMAMVEEGLVDPVQGRSPTDWRFPALAVRRVRVAVRLQRDLQINLAGVALAMDLLEELHALRARVRSLERQVLGHLE